MKLNLKSNQLYELNDVLTHTLAAMGWNVVTEEDAEKLNDAVLDIAGRFFGEPNETETVLVKITNHYSDGHESEREVRLPQPQTLDAWWNDVVFPETGDGHGADNPDLGTCYTATIIEAYDQDLVGEEWEWV